VVIIYNQMFMMHQVFKTMNK